jgi:mannosyl-3-phosphoglycerate phosphatase
LKSETTRVVVFTDLDGTLLNEKYEFEDVMPIVARLLDSRVPIVFCSSKTRAEIEYYREKLGINDPFISENGAAIFIPKGYFTLKHNYTKQTDRYDIIELGITYSVIREKLDIIRKTSAGKIIGFGDMTAEEIAEDSGLPLNLAELAKQREYTEPFIIQQGSAKFSAIEKEGLHYTSGGKYFQLTGGHNKGQAVSILKELYAQESQKLITVGVGNHTNDIEMLTVVDMPFMVPKMEELQSVWDRISRAILHLSFDKCCN